MRTPQVSIVVRVGKEIGQPDIRLSRRPEAAVDRQSVSTSAEVGIEHTVLMGSREYKVAASVGYGKVEFQLVPTLFDAGCGLNLVDVGHLARTWKDHILPQGQEPRLFSDSHNSFASWGAYA